MSTKKILIIDDEEVFCETLKKALNRLGNYKVDMAFNGKDGLERAKKTMPDLILLDIMMPGLNGLQVLERLKAHEDTLQIPVVMLTAQDEDVARERASELYGDLFLTKPVNIMELRFKIETLLKRRGIT